MTDPKPMTPEERAHAVVRRGCYATEAEVASAIRAAVEDAVARVRGEEVEPLLDALEEYGEHEKSCALPSCPCDCGFGAVLDLIAAIRGRKGER